MAAGVVFIAVGLGLLYTSSRLWRVTDDQGMRVAAAFGFVLAVGGVATGVLALFRA